MKILYSTPNLNMKESYDLIRNPACEKMADHVGETVAVDQYMVREEERAATQEIVKIVSIKSGEKFLATNSQVFFRGFCAIIEMCASCNDTVHHIEITTGKSKKGRDFVTCIYID